MFLSWAAITALNIAWTLFLWRRRDRDDSWLWKFFAVYTISDSIFWLAGTPDIGGLHLIRREHMGHDLWTLWVCALWFSWFLAPLFVALRLAHGRVSRCWIAAAVTVAVLLSASESLGLTPYQRRFLMHRMYEPALLSCAAWFVIRGSVAKIRKGELPRFLAYAVLASVTLLSIRLVWLYTLDLELRRVAARGLYFTYIGGVMLVYRYRSRIKRWMLLTSD